MIGRRVMLRIARSCVENGGRLRLLTPSSALVEYDVESSEYLGVYIDWLPFDNLINLPLRFITRPKPIVIAKVEPRSKIKGYVSLIARSRDEALKGAYEVKHSSISKPKLDKIIRSASQHGFERVIIGGKPNITIITVLRGDCNSLVQSIKKFVDDIVGG